MTGGRNTNLLVNFEIATDWAVNCVRRAAGQSLEIMVARFAMVFVNGHRALDSLS